MKLMFPKKISVFAILATLPFLIFCVGGVSAQRKKAQPPTSSKTKVQSKAQSKVQSKKVDKKATNAKNSKVDKNATNTKNAKNDKRSNKEKLADAKVLKDPKKLATNKKAEAERLRREKERQAAILAELRRREQAAREARARKLAFEHGLRTETVNNIAKDITEGEDLNIRQAAIEALGNKAGSVVVMEAQTGKILTIVNQDWAVRSAIRPCSTIKLVTGAAGLNEGVIDKENGSIRNTSTRRNLDDAIAFSDNGYFQRVGANVGSPKVIEYARKFGLGQQTGINLEGETAGKLPYGNNNLRIYSHGDDFEVSTVQLAVMVSEITNGGKRLIPRIPRNTLEKTRFQPFMRERLDLPQQNVRRMIPGMMGAAEYGTAHRGVDASQGIAGKTGSCISKGSWVGLFVSVAPIENPKYAVAVITRGQSERGKYAAAVAGKIYRSLSSNIVRTDRNLAQTEFKIAPKRSADAKTADTLADAEGEDDADSTGEKPVTARDARIADDAGRDIIIVPNMPESVVVEKTAPKKLVQKTGSSAPKFPPVVITYPKDKATNKRDRVVKP